MLVLIIASRRFEVLQQLLHLIEHALGVGHIARARHFLHLIQHPLQVLRCDGAVLWAWLILVLRLVLLAHLLFCELLKETIKRRAHLVHQTLDLVVGGAALQRFAKRLLGSAKVAFRLRQVAFFKLQRHLPDEVRDVTQIIIVFRRNQAI